MSAGAAASSGAAESPLSTLSGQYEEPIRVIQRAWSVFRLDRVQQLTTEIITELRASAQGGAADPPPGQVLDEPVAAALEACCVELCEASGIRAPGATAADQYRVLFALIAEQPLSWSSVFTGALDGYRRLASYRLNAVFAAESEAWKKGSSAPF